MVNETRRALCIYYKGGGHAEHPPLIGELHLFCSIHFYNLYPFSDDLV